MNKKKVIKLYPTKRKNFNLKLSILIITIVFFATSLILYNFFITIKCKDIDYAIEYSLKSKVKSEYRLLNIKKKEILSQDNNYYKLKVTGMSKTPPHGSTTLEVSFTKDKNNVWTIEDYNFL